MIPAGTLKYKLDFYKITISQSDSGFVSSSKEFYFSSKASLKKMSGDLKENAKEQFHTEILNFKLRYDKRLSNDLIVKYLDNDFKVLFIERNLFDNSVVLTIEKSND